ncbi:hypothetical protein PhCBS80983_g03098 [Powellomyces hirtus]|uniref:Uncharacterized protein n=1 Tax=Powellomyces hirtus TaxID=109895 RepID=A0A507E528_9FUNG|nr:hypothetical protein PhCBS80983_g03098 [Powellomyces hirtus]
MSSLDSSSRQTVPRPTDEHSTVQAFRARVATNRQQAAEEKLRRVNRVLRRAEVSKVANALRKRLEYAKFKVQHGWSQKTFGEIKDMYAATLQNSTGDSDATAGKESRAVGGSDDMDVSSPPPQQSPVHNRLRVPNATVSPASSDRDNNEKSNLATVLTNKLRAETDAYFARLGLPSIYDAQGWDSQHATANATTKSRTPSSVRNYFPSPAPSPVISRASSPTTPMLSSAGFPVDADAEQGALLLMMMQGTRR